MSLPKDRWCSFFSRSARTYALAHSHSRPFPGPPSGSGPPISTWTCDSSPKQPSLSSFVVRDVFFSSIPSFPRQFLTREDVKVHFPPTVVVIPVPPFMRFQPPVFGEGINTSLPPECRGFFPLKLGRRTSSPQASRPPFSGIRM